MQTAPKDGLDDAGSLRERISDYDPLLWSLAIGDSQDERQESFSRLRAHVLARVDRYSFREGYTFGAWVKRVAVNWRLSELRKPRGELQLLSVREESIPSADVFADVEMKALYLRLGRPFRIVFLQFAGLIGKQERSRLLSSMGYNLKAAAGLESELREWLSAGYGVLKGGMASQILIPSPVRYLTSEQYSALPCDERLLLMAASKVGVTEDYPYRNLGKEVEYFQKRAGGSKGDPWCGEFVQACALDAGFPRSVLPAHPQSGVGWLDWGKKTGRAHQDWPHRGDVFVIRFNKTQSHVGLVVKADGEDFWTVEGNTNPGGGREGYGVFRREREDNDATWFLTMKGLCG